MPMSMIVTNSDTQNEIRQHLSLVVLRMLRYYRTDASGYETLSSSTSLSPLRLREEKYIQSYDIL